MLLIDVIVSKKTRYEVYCAAVDLKGELAVTYIFETTNIFSLYVPILSFTNIVHLTYLLNQWLPCSKILDPPLM